MYVALKPVLPKDIVAERSGNLMQKTSEGDLF